MRPPKKNTANKCANTVCPRDEVCNPPTGRCVKRTGVIGTRLLSSQQQQQQPKNKKNSNVPPQAPNRDPITQNVIPASHRVVVDRYPYDVTSLAALVHHATHRDPIYGVRPARLPLPVRNITPAEAAAWTKEARKLGWKPEAPATAIRNANRAVPADLRATSAANRNRLARELAARQAQASAAARNAAVLARQRQQERNSMLRQTPNEVPEVPGIVEWLLGIGPNPDSEERWTLQRLMQDEDIPAFMDILVRHPHIVHNRPVLLAILCKGEIGEESVGLGLVEGLSGTREDWRSLIEEVLSMWPAAAHVIGADGRAPLHNYLSRGPDGPLLHQIQQGDVQPLSVNSRVVGALLAAAPEIAWRPTNRRGQLPLHLLIASCILPYDDDVSRGLYNFKFDVFLTHEDVICAQMLLARYPEAKRIEDRSGRTPLDYLNEFERNEQTKNSVRRTVREGVSELNDMLRNQARAIADLRRLLSRVPRF